MSPDSETKLTVFISYSRRDEKVADLLLGSLEDSGYQVTLDKRNLPYGEIWQNELSELIRASDTVLWLVSPNSTASKWCRWELAEVVRMRKRVIPILISPVHSSALPEALEKLQHLPQRGVFNINHHFSILTQALDSDHKWVKEATRLMDRAHQWLSHKRQQSFLLRGTELQSAEHWSARIPARSPGVPIDVIELISASKSAIIRQQRFITLASLLFGLFALSLSIFAYIQRNEALANQSRLLAKASLEQTRKGNAGTALLLAIEGSPKNSAFLERPIIEDSLVALNDALYALRELRVFNGHTADVNTVSFIEDGKQILTSSDDGTLRVFDIQTGKQNRILAPHGKKVYWAKKKDPYIITTGDDNNVLIWNSTFTNQLKRLKGHSRRVLDVDLHPIQELAVTASADGTVRLWRIKGDEIPTILQGHSAAVNTAVFSPDGRSILTSSDDFTARLWDIHKETSQKILKGHDDFVTSAIFSHDGSLIATSSFDRTVRVWDVTTGYLIRVLAGHSAPVMLITFSHDDDTLLSAGMDGTVKQWEVETGNLLLDLPAHDGPISRLKILRDRNIIITTGRDSLIKFWDFPSGRKLASLAGHEAAVFDIAVSNGGLLLTSSRDGTARLWSIDSPVISKTLPGQFGEYTCLDISHDGNVVVVGRADGSMFLWDLKTVSTFSKIPAHSSGVEVVALNGDGTRLLSLEREGDMVLWQVPKIKELLRVRSVNRSATSVDLDNSGMKAAVGFSDGGVVFIDVADGGKITQLGTHEKPVSTVRFSSNGAEVVSGSVDGVTMVWGISNSRERVRFSDGMVAIIDAQFVKADTLVVTVAEDGIIRFWDTDRSRIIAKIGPQSAPVSKISVSLRDNIIVSSLLDGTLTVWDWSMQSLLATYRGHLHDALQATFIGSTNRIVSISKNDSPQVWEVGLDAVRVSELARIVRPRCFRPNQLREFGLPINSMSDCLIEIGKKRP